LGLFGIAIISVILMALVKSIEFDIKPRVHVFQFTKLYFTTIMNIEQSIVCHKLSHYISWLWLHIIVISHSQRQSQNKLHTSKVIIGNIYITLNE